MMDGITGCRWQDDREVKHGGIKHQTRRKGIVVHAMTMGGGYASEAAFPTTKTPTAFTHRSSTIYLSIVFTGWRVCSKAHL